MAEEYTGVTLLNFCSEENNVTIKKIKLKISLWKECSANFTANMTILKVCSFIF